MFVYSLRASTLKFFAFLFVSVGLLVGIVLWGSSEAVPTSVQSDISLSGIKGNEERVRFIENLGVSVESEPCEEKSFQLPKDFDRITGSYNEIQKSQGLDLSKYKGKKLTRYTYKVTNFAKDGKDAYASVFVYRKTIVACDLTETGEEGRVYPLLAIDKSLLKK